MRTVLIIALLFVMVLPSLAELTQQDLEKISNLIDRKLEPIKLDIAMMKGELKAMEGELKAMKGELKALDSKMATKDDLITIRDNFQNDLTAIRGEIHSLYRWLIAMWVTIILAIFGIPYLYGRADREKVKQLEAKVRELTKLRTDVEALKAIKEAEEKRRETARRIAEENPEFEEAYRLLGLL